MNDISGTEGLATMCIFQSPCRHCLVVQLPGDHLAIGVRYKDIVKRQMFAILTSIMLHDRCVAVIAHQRMRTNKERAKKRRLRLKVIIPGHDHFNIQAKSKSGRLWKSKCMLRVVLSFCN